MTTGFSAAGPMLGYLFQSRQALLLAIRLYKTSPSLTISIERFDDIAVEDANAPAVQLQLKHHIKPAELTDTSVDFWKTLRVWTEQVNANPQLPFETRFAIVSTAVAPTGSAAAHLREGRSEADVTVAFKLLKAAAETSTNATTANARAAFLALSMAEQKSLLSSIQVLDKAPNITNVRGDIEDILAFAAPNEHVSSLVDYLEGWWFNQVVRSLIHPNTPSMPILTVRSKIDELATAFRQQELLLTPDLQVDPDAKDLASEQRTFVRQMHCVGLGPGPIDRAKRDFYRASTQRSEWARVNALLDGEAAKYDRTLVDRWERERDAAHAGADMSTEEAKRKVGVAVFHWADRFQWPFRNRHEAWLTTGSLHMLADRLTIGWHPDFIDLLKEKE